MPASKSPSPVDADDDGVYANPYIDSDMRGHPDLLRVLFPDPLARDLPYLSFILYKTDLYDHAVQRWSHSPTDGEQDSVAAFLHRISEAIAVAYKAPSAYHWIQSSKSPVATLMSKEYIEPGYYRRACYVHASGDFEADLRSLVKNVRWENYNFDNRRFVIGLIFDGDSLYVVHHDRGGRIVSIPINYHKDPGFLVRVLLSLMHGSDHRLGYDPSFFFDKKTEKCMITCDHKDYEVIEKVYNSQDLYGPCCVVWRVRRDGKDYIIKDVWSDAAFAEMKMMGKLAGVEGIAQLVAFDVPRTDELAGTSTSQYRLDYFDLDDERYELVISRTQTRMVISPIGDDMEHFKSMKEFIGLFIDTIKAHGRMKDKGIVYKDISMGNLMFDADSYDEELDRRRGMIIDFGTCMEMGKVLQNYDLIDRAGTPVFMAIDVLLHAPGPEHQPHHDLESFFYVLLWSCITFVGPAERSAGVPTINEKTTPLVLWANIDGRNFLDVGSIKRDMMTDAERFQTDLLDNFQPYFRRLVPFMELLRRVIFDRTYEEGPVLHEEMVDVLQQAYDTIKVVKEEEMPVLVAPSMPPVVSKRRREEDEEICGSPAKRSRNDSHDKPPTTRGKRGTSPLPAVLIPVDEHSTRPCSLSSASDDLALVLYVPPPILKRRRGPGDNNDDDDDDDDETMSSSSLLRKRHRSSAGSRGKASRPRPPHSRSSSSSLSRSRSSSRSRSVSDDDVSLPVSPAKQ